jgi:hypothetical protein
MRISLGAALLACSAALACADDTFEDPKLITSEGKPIQVQSPGYAVPCLADLDGDGVRDLLVGQFKKGKISLFKGKEAGSTDFAAHAWLQAGGADVEIPGVW